MVRTRAAIDGKEITFEDGNDNVRGHRTLEVDIIDVRTSIPAGLRTAWLDGGNEDYEISLSAGAGFGSKYASLSIKDKATDETIYQGILDAEQLVAVWMDSVIKSLNGA